MRDEFQRCKEAYLSRENTDNDEKAKPRAGDTANGLERNLFDGVTVESPSFPESNMGKADRPPSKECSQSRQGKEPVEDC